jgi:uncharacterized membrane protein YpjA
LLSIDLGVANHKMYLSSFHVSSLWTKSVLSSWVDANGVTQYSYYQRPDNPTLEVMSFKVGAHYRDASGTGSSYFYAVGSLLSSSFSGNYGESKTFGADAPVIE